MQYPTIANKNTPKEMERFFTTLQIICATVMASGVTTVTLYHTFKGHMKAFPGIMMFLMCAVAIYLFFLSWKELKEAYSK